MPRAVRWTLIGLAVLAAARTIVLFNAWLLFDQQQVTCRAEAAKQYGIVTGWVLPAAYPSHYDATLGTCTFFYQSFPPKVKVPTDYWMESYSGTILAQENSPGDAYKETCVFQDQEIDCADFERAVNQIMTQ